MTNFHFEEFLIFALYRLALRLMRVEEHEADMEELQKRPEKRSDFSGFIWDQIQDEDDEFSRKMRFEELQALVQSREQTMCSDHDIAFSQFREKFLEQLEYEKSNVLTLFNDELPKSALWDKIF